MFVDTQSGKVCSEIEVRARYSNKSLPAVLTDDNLNDTPYRILTPRVATLGEYEVISVPTVVHEDGRWYYDQVAVPMTESQIDNLNKVKKAESENLIRSVIHNTAQDCGYDSIETAVSYAGYENEYQAEAIALGRWRSAVWSWFFKQEGPISLEDVPKYPLANE